MLQRIALAVVALAVAAPAAAQSKEYYKPYYQSRPYTYQPYTYQPYTYTPRSGSTYDWRSGNSYTWRKDSTGTTKLNGLNLNTGSTWNTQIKRNGDMSGFDSRGNYWSYDKQTGNYFSTDGTICFGKGPTRTCY
jgi:hypothetical protein